MKTNLKVKYFHTLCCSESWPLTKQLKKRVQWHYTNMLCVTQNVSWIDYLTKEQLYGDTPTQLDTIRQRRLRFSGHYCCSKNEVISQLHFLEPKHGSRCRF